VRFAFALESAHAPALPLLRGKANRAVFWLLAFAVLALAFALVACCQEKAHVFLCAFLSNRQVRLASSLLFFGQKKPPTNRGSKFAALFLLWKQPI